MTTPAFNNSYFLTKLATAGALHKKPKFLPRQWVDHSNAFYPKLIQRPFKSHQR